MKVRDLFEAAVGADLSIHELNLTPQETLDFMHEHCSDAAWMLRDDTPIVRGGLTINGVSTVDPSKTVRRSQNTENHYTEILDNIPSMKDFPKRSRSLIASTSVETAHGFGKVSYVIPFNGTPIGVVNQPDMWWANTGFAYDLTIRSVPHMLRGIPPEWGSIIDTLTGIGNVLDEKLSGELTYNIDDALDDILTTMLSYLKIDSYRDVDKLKQLRDDLMDPIEWLDRNMSPSITRVTLHTTKNLNPLPENSEVWIGGPVLLINPATWAGMLNMRGNK